MFWRSYYSLCLLFGDNVTMFVIVSTIPYMYKCDTCKEPIMEKEAVGIRTHEGKNLYFHKKEECEPPEYEWLDYVPSNEENKSE